MVVGKVDRRSGDESFMFVHAMALLPTILQPVQRHRGK